MKYKATFYYLQAAMDPSAEIPQKDVCNIFIPSSAKTDQLDTRC